MITELYIEKLISNSDNLIAAFINENSFEIFKEYKKTATEDELNFYKDVTIKTHNDDEGTFEIGFQYKENHYTMYISYDGEVTTFFQN